ncbi:LysR family transcriptional regulator [Rhodococcus koreensis]|uniref:Regulatory helix-turn-helix protein, lysR family n=1 Tax=Rhodococcus koreensis TaxID=99653 RepID=A0A1H4WGE1_9NOCA|nr:LysR family transcriptional regulator [Rhodococcus koreensis]SEC92376.1 regulatory helix-turn-helix protein, lysR family [Rhodococcus koreensis]
MDVKQLTALVAVADAGSVTRAAELLHLVQPAVTRQIHTLEQELGVPLFERSRAGMELTEPGRLMLERARRVLAELERARAEIRPNPGVLQGIVMVRLLASTSELLAEQLVAAVLREHPAVRLRIVSAGPGSSSAPELRFSVRLVGEDFLLYPPRCLNRHTGDDREGCRRRGRSARSTDVRLRVFT